MHPTLKNSLLLWPLLYLVVIFIVAPLFAVATPIPLLALIGLLYISAIMTKNMVIIWAIIYTLVVGCMYFNIRIWNYVHSGYHDPINQYSYSENIFRFVIFLITAFFAICFSLANDKLINLRNFYQKIINSLDEAVILSDIDGRIQYHNTSAQELLRDHGYINEYNGAPPSKVNIIEIFFDSKHRGKMLSKYIEAFDTQNPELELRLHGVVVKSKIKKIKKLNRDLMMIIIRL